MRRLLSNRDHVVLLLLLFIGTVAYFSFENHNGHRGGVAELDGYYYYVYLRSVQMDGDLSFGNEYQLWGNPFKLGSTPTGYYRNIFGIGPAVLWTPFFLITHLIAWVSVKMGSHLSLDGFSRFHQVGTLYGTLFYGWIAVLLCYQIARRVLGKAGALWGTLGVALAGPLPCYVLTWASFSHAQAAMATSLMILLWVTWRDHWSLRRWIIFGASAGLVVLVRPACFPFLLLPLWEGGRVIYAALRARPAQFSDLVPPLAGAAAAFVVFLPQMLVWKLFFGQFLVTPQGEGFMWWSQTAWYSTLFSPRNGLLPWAPLLAVALLGLGLAARKYPRTILPMWGIFITLVVVNGAVSDWWGWGFSSRRYTCALPIFTLGLSYVIRGIQARLVANPTRTVAWLTAAVVLLAIVFNLQWMRNFSRRNMTWSSVHSTEGMYMTTTHSLLDRVYSTVGNPLSLPASIAFTIRRGGTPRIFDRIDGTYMLGESHLQANPSAKPFRHSTLKMGDLRYRFHLSDSFDNPRKTGDGIGYAPLRDPRGHVFLPVNRPGALQMMVGGRATRPGTRVELRFNDRSLAVKNLPTRWTQLFLAVPAALVDRGINRLDLIHHLPPGWDEPSSRCIGETGVCLPVDLAVVSGGRSWGNFAEVWVDNRKVSRNVRGLNVAVVDPSTGTLLASRSYDTFAYPILYRELVRHLRAFPQKSVVALGTRDSPARHFKQGGAQALATIGAVTDLRRSKEAGYAVIGVLGARPGTALESWKEQGHARVRVGRPPPPWREIAQYRVIQVR